MGKIRGVLMAAVAAAGLWAVACRDNPTTPAHQHTTAVVAVDKTSLNLQVGDFANLTARPTCACGEATSAAVSWTSSNDAVATVSPTGVVTAVAFGTATVTATADGKATNVAVTVQPTGTVVGALGGIVTSANGAAVLDIPAGALDAPTDITITPVADADFGGDATFLAGSGYEIKPAGAVLHQAVQLRVAFDPAKLPTGVVQEQLRIRERDRAQNQWRDCDQQGLDGQHVRAGLTQFGAFGIIVQPPVGKYVGALGGTVVSADGNAELIIPAGALDVATDISVVKVDDSEFSGDQTYVGNTGYKVEPAGLMLNKPATMNIKYDPANVPGGVDLTQLRIQQRDRTQNRWQDCDQPGIQGHLVGAKVSTFGTFGVTGKAASGPAPVAQVLVRPSVVNVDEGDVVQMSADVQDADGNSLNVPVTWSVDNTSVATIDEDGTLTAIADGTTSVSATAGGKSGGSSVNVSKKVSSVTITGDNTITVGATSQLTAVANGTSGSVSVTFTWTSDNAAVATVSSTGLVTGVAAGTAVVTASAKGVSGTITITVSTTGGGGGGGGGGGETTTTGNNVSWPVVFAEGTGLTGSPVATDAGTRPAATEADALAELLAIAVTSPTAPFWWTGNVVDGTGYYLQATANTWRGQIVDGTGQPKYDAEAAWGDNLTGTGNLSAGHPIRVEVALSATGIGTLQGYNMPYVANPSSPDEIQGTDGTLGDFVPLIYSVGPTLTIEQLSGPGGSVTGVFSTGIISAEVNVGGRIVYGQQFKPTVAGTYRLRFILASGNNVNITSAINGIVVNGGESSIEVTVTP